MEYGKFNSVEELLKGYNELEKSFTQKCQQLSAVQKASGTNDDLSSPQTEEVAAAVDAAPADADAQPAVNRETSPNAAIQQIRQYLDAHPHERDQLLKEGNNAAATLPKIMNCGGNVSLSAPSRPKTIKEASLMAKDLFRNA